MTVSRRAETEENTQKQVDHISEKGYESDALCMGKDEDVCQLRTSRKLNQCQK